MKMLDCHTCVLLIMNEPIPQHVDLWVLLAFIKKERRRLAFPQGKYISTCTALKLYNSGADKSRRRDGLLLRDNKST